MYIVILGEIINYGEIVYDATRLRVLANKNYSLQDQINVDYKEHICSKFSSAHADYIEGVLCDSDIAWEVAQEIVQKIVEQLSPFQIDIAIVKGELDIVDPRKADYSNGPAFWAAADTVKNNKSDANGMSNIMIVDEIITQSTKRKKK